MRMFLPWPHKYKNENVVISIDITRNNMPKSTNLVKKDKAIEFAVFLSRLVLKNGGTIPSRTEELFDDWMNDCVKMLNPSPLVKEEVVKKNNVKGECRYVHQRKANKGTLCGVHTKGGRDYCPKHLAYIKLKEKKSLERS
jgi:hypothetical protein